MFTVFSDVFMSSSYSELADHLGSVYEVFSIFYALNSDLRFVADIEEDDRSLSDLIEKGNTYETIESSQ